MLGIGSVVIVFLNERFEGGEGCLWSEMAIYEDETVFGNIAHLHGGER